MTFPQTSRLDRRSASAVAAALSLCAAAFAQPAAAHELPLGDGKISDAPRAGFVFSCQQNFNPNAPGARREGPWILGETWDPTVKVVVDGAVDWPNAAVDVALAGATRVVTANNLPDHPTGVFPIERSSEAYAYDRNPNAIRAQSILLELPATPVAAAEPSCVPMGMIGFMLSGGALFNALDARGEDAPAHEIQDACGGHPEQRGQYHYHAASPCLVDGRSGPDGHSDLLGYALDGFGIYGPYDGGGVLMTNETLDECGGHVGPVLWDGEIVEIYHYHMRDAYPYSVGCFRGDPGPAAAQRRPDRGFLGALFGRDDAVRPRGLGARRGGPLAGAAAELGITERALRDAVGGRPPNVERAALILGISEERIHAALRNNRPR